MLKGFSLVLFGLGAAVAAEPTVYRFDLPAETADRSLKRFSEQSGLEVLFPTQVARRARTHAVQGEMTAKEALERMLANTGLVIVEDPEARAFSIRWENPKKNGQRAASPTSNDRPTKQKLTYTLQIPHQPNHP